MVTLHDSYFSFIYYLTTIALFCMYAALILAFVVRLFLIAIFRFFVFACCFHSLLICIIIPFASY